MAPPNPDGRLEKLSAIFSNRVKDPVDEGECEDVNAAMSGAAATVSGTNGAVGSATTGAEIGASDPEKGGLTDAALGIVEDTSVAASDSVAPSLEAFSMFGASVSQAQSSPARNPPPSTPADATVAPLARLRPAALNALSELVLSDCSITDETMNFLGEALTYSDPTKPKVHSKGAAKPPEGTLATLRIIDLSKNCISRSGKAIARLISTAPVLTSLDLSWNNLRDEDALWVAESFDSAVALEHVNLQWNNFGEEAVHLRSDTAMAPAANGAKISSIPAVSRGPGVRITTHPTIPHHVTKARESRWWIDQYVQSISRRLTLSQLVSIMVMVMDHHDCTGARRGSR